MKFRLRYPVYIFCLYCAFQCGQLYKASHYVEGLPEVAVSQRELPFADENASLIVAHFYSVED